jgi:hypothetical protein
VIDWESIHPHATQRTESYTFNKSKLSNNQSQQVSFFDQPIPALLIGWILQEVDYCRDHPSVAKHKAQPRSPSDSSTALSSNHDESAFMHLSSRSPRCH